MTATEHRAADDPAATDTTGTAMTGSGVTGGTRRRVARVLIILGSLSAVTPLTVDMYLPAMPQIADSLGTGAPQVQLTLSAFIVGLAIGHLVAGPLGDTYGRRRPLLIGLVAYIGVSTACAFAPSIWPLTGLRLLQALGVATALVLSRAVVRDLYSGPRLARTFSTLMLVSGLAPILAPVIGAQLLRFTDWRGIFLTFTVFGGLLLAATALGLPETLPPQRRRPASVRRTLGTYRMLVGDRMFMGYALAAGLACAVMFAYIGGSSFVLQEHFGLSPQEFSAVFGGNAVGIVLVAQVNGRLVGRVPARRLMAVGLVTIAVADLALVGAALADLGLAAILVPLVVSVAAIGLVLPNGAALAMADHADHAGTASALLGMLQFVAGGVAAPLVGLGGHASPVSMGVVMAGSSLLALLVFGVLTRRRRPDRVREADEAEAALPSF
ncbi:MAG TPA: multidrug effflux MFS transporter [Pseudonocardiaceae bacterium]